MELKNKNGNNGKKKQKKTRTPSRSNLIFKKKLYYKINYGAQT